MEARGNARREAEGETLTAVDEYELERQQMQEAAARAERIRHQNLETFQKMWLTLGIDVVRVTNQMLQGEVAEALSVASHRWSRLADLESQITREEASLAARPKKRPTQPGDEMAPDRTIAEWESKWIAETEGLREQLKVLKTEAKQTRAELESYRRK